MRLCHGKPPAQIDCMNSSKFVHPSIASPKWGLLACLLIAHLTGWCQEVVVTRDAGMWLGVKVEKRVATGWKINLEHQLRTYENGMGLDDALLNLGANYKIDKQFKVAADIRYTFNARRTKDAVNEYRYNIDFHWRRDLGDHASIRYRLRHQKEQANVFEEWGQTNDHETKFRHRIKFIHQVTKNKHPYASIELHRVSRSFREPHFDQFRMHVGHVWLTENHAWDLSMGYTRELHATYPLNFIFLFAQWNVDL